MPSLRHAPAPTAAPSSQGLVVLIHAHEDRLTPKSKLITFVRAAANNEGYDFWWDFDINHPDFNHEILGRLEKAKLVVCVLSQGFFDSAYIQNVEARVLQRRIGQDLLVVPVKYSPYLSNPRYGWLSDLHHVPAKVESIYGADRQLLLYKEVAEYVQRLLRGGKITPFAARESLYAIRPLPNDSFSTAERRLLRDDAKKWAEHYVPDPKLRQRISEEARRLGASLGTPLSKPQLAKLDAKFLAHKEKRNPDPKKIRWVLRAAGLHPQGRAPKALVAA